MKKVKYSFFHKPSKNMIDDIPLVLPKLNINNGEIARTESIRFLVVLLEEKFGKHIKYVENKISKNIGISFKARPFLNRKPLLLLYYSYILNYISYGSVSWGSTCWTNLKKKTKVNKSMLFASFLIKVNLSKSVI